MRHVFGGRASQPDKQAASSSEVGRFETETLSTKRNLTWRSKRVVRFYNGRGTAEQWIKEGKNSVKWTKLSCRTFKDN